MSSNASFRRPVAPAPASGAENLLLDIAEVSLCGSRGSSGRFGAPLQTLYSSSQRGGVEPSAGMTPTKSTRNQRRMKAKETTPGMFELDDADEPTSQDHHELPSPTSFAVPPEDVSSSRFATSEGRATSWLDGGVTSSALSSNARPQASAVPSQGSNFAANWSFARRGSARPILATGQRDVVQQLSFSGESGACPVSAGSLGTATVTPPSVDAVARPLSWDATA